MIPQVEIPKLTRAESEEIKGVQIGEDEAVPDVMRPVSSKTKDKIYNGISKEGFYIY